MSKDEFYLKQILDGIKDSVDDVKDNMTTQHAAFGVKLDMLIDRHATTDKKADKAHERLDDITNPEYGILASLKKTADQALRYGEDYNDNKKKVMFGGSILVALGAFATWIGGFFWK